MHPGRIEVLVPVLLLQLGYGAVGFLGSLRLDSNRLWNPANVYTATASTRRMILIGDSKFMAAPLIEAKPSAIYHAAGLCFGRSYRGSA
jgi:hypothetical protein